MNIVFPMVGLGKRFVDMGYDKPKPLIVVKNKTIIEHAVESFAIEGQYIFIIRTSDFSEELKKILKKIKPKCIILEVDYLTEGSVSSILLSKQIINNSEELITTNCDQRTNWNYNKFLQTCRKENVDGCVVTYSHDNFILNSISPYSFIEVGKNNFATRLEEKLTISNLALCGIHYWKTGKMFVDSAEKMIKDNVRINNEFYVSKTYNYLIKEGKNITYHPLEKHEFISLGTPKDLEKFKDDY